jgi:replicative DNA helicase
MVENSGIKIVFIDYLGLIHSDSKGLSRQEQKMEIMASIKNMASDFGIPIIALETLKRPAEELGVQERFDLIPEGADAVLLMDDACKEITSVTKEVKIHVCRRQSRKIGDATLLFRKELALFESGELFSLSDAFSS